MQIPLYKRDPVQYRKVHAWLNKNHRKPRSCNYCGATDCRIEWANVSGEYKKDRQDFLALCAKHHHQWDKGIIEIGDIKHFDGEIPKEHRRLMGKIGNTTEQKRIVAKRRYRLKDMIDDNAFPFITGGERQKYREYAAVIEADMNFENTLGASRVPQGHKSSYSVPGSGIIKFMKLYGAGMRIAWHKKHKRS